VVAFSAKPTEQEAAAEVVPLTRERTAGRRGIRWISDGLRAYRDLVRWVYRDPVRTRRNVRPRLVPTPGVGLTQVVKHRVGGRVRKVTRRHCFGVETPDHHTVRVERLNGCLRDRHKALRERAADLPNGRRYRQRTPAMAIGLSDHVWSWSEFLSCRISH
jgi:hypothetical protein